MINKGDNMSKTGNLYLELTERAQDFIADYADKKYFTLMDAKDSFLDECGEDAAGIFDQEAETASEIGII
tara:strand:- start:605 stop:814 length:210 start_codon:yes stop_codon:yes gene_type:complete